MIDAVLFILVPWGFIFGVFLALNLNLFRGFFFKEYETFNALHPAESVFMSAMFVPLFLFVPYQDKKVSFDPISDFVWERLFVTVLVIGFGFALAKWARSEELI